MWVRIFFLVVALGLAQAASAQPFVERYMEFGGNRVLREIGFLNHDGSFMSSGGTVYPYSHIIAQLNQPTMEKIEGRALETPLGWPGQTALGFTQGFRLAGEPYLFGGGTFHEVRRDGVEENPMLVNLSTRGMVPSGEPMIVGTYVSGGPVNLLVRAIGPGLVPHGITQPLGDPRIEVVNASGTTLATNDNWSTEDAANLSSTFPKVGAFPLPLGSLDAAVLITLQPGAYTFVVWGKASQSGVALVEAYRAPGSIGRLVNLSTRGYVGEGEGSLIAGFAVEHKSPTSRRRLVVRAVGPELAAFGVPGSVADPKMALHDTNEKLQENDDAALGDARVSRHVGAFRLDETYNDNSTYKNGVFHGGTKSAVLQASLVGGNYTVVVSSKNKQHGTGLVELYEYQD